MSASLQNRRRGQSQSLVAEHRANQKLKKKIKGSSKIECFNVSNFVLTNRLMVSFRYSVPHLVFSQTTQVVGSNSIMTLRMVLLSRLSIKRLRPQPTRRTSLKLVANPGSQLASTQLFWVANKLAT